MNYADKINVENVVIIGKKDLDEGNVTVKNMTTGMQDTVKIEAIVNYIKGE